MEHKEIELMTFEEFAKKQDEMAGTDAIVGGKKRPPSQRFPHGEGDKVNVWGAPGKGMKKGMKK